MAKTFPIIALLFLFSCGSKKAKDNAQINDKPRIAVVNYPLYYFAKTIGRDHVTVYFPVMDGDPAYWKPTAKQVINYQNADLIVANGAGYAKWLEKVSLPSSKLIYTADGFKDMWIETSEGLAHSHGAEGEHVHKGTAFTTWLNFKLAAEQAKSIYNSMTALVPDHAEELNGNFEQLMTSLSVLDKRMEGVASKIGQELLIASHPIYQYLEASYGLNMVSKHWEPDEMPTVDQWDDLKKIITENQARVMIWEDNPIEEIKSKLLELKVSVVVFNPCANVPEVGDFMDMMNENLNQLELVVGIM